MDNDLLIARIMTFVILLIGTFCFGILSLAVQRTLLTCDCEGLCGSSCRARKGKLVISFLIYIGGGVLLATCFIHLLPDTREGFAKSHGYHLFNNTASFNGTFEELTHHGIFPMPEFIICMGFFAVYLFDQIILYFLSGNSPLQTEFKAIRSLSRSSSLNIEDFVPGTLTTIEEAPDDRNTKGVKIDKKERKLSRVLPKNLSVSGLLTVAALSFHSLFEGFAIGLQSSPLSTWIVFAAVAFHKFVLAFVIGVQVHGSDGGGTAQVCSYMAVFACMSPLGMAVAMVTGIHVEERSPLVVSVMNSIATGTLLYVTFFEILQNDEQKDNVSYQVQFLATFLGFSMLCLVEYGSTFA